LVYRAFFVLWLWSHEHLRLAEPPRQDHLRDKTKLKNRVELVNKALLSYQKSKDSIGAWPIDIIGQDEAEVAENIFPNLVIVSSRIV
jgi:hypothetical protein